jgi:hypothetical protein
MQLTSFQGRVLSISFAALVLLPMACGGNSSSGTQSTAPVPSSDFATHFAQSYCSSIKACCAQSGYATSTCESALQAQLNAALTTLSSDPNVLYDAAAGARFIDEYASLNSACTNPSIAGTFDVNWSNVFKGTVALGGTCGSSQDCIKASGGYVSCNAGVCTLDSSDPFDAPHATLGQACAGTCSSSGNSGSCGGGVAGASPATTTAHCWTNDGLYCNNGTCVAVPTIGQTCGASNYCEMAGHCQNSTCVADTAAGPCSSDEACLSASYCDFTANVCMPKKANGLACNSDSECTGGQCEQDICRNWTIATAAACAGLLDD